MINCYRTYTLTLQAPAIISTLSGDPNSSTTLQYIPGTAIRGSLARALEDQNQNLKSNSEFCDLIFSDSVAYLNAYPCHNNRRSLPIPISMRGERNTISENGPINIWDLASCDESNWPEESLAMPSAKYITLGLASPLIVEPQLGNRVHQQRDRQRGRAWTEQDTEIPHGAVFTYEYLESEQNFQGIIRIRSKTEDDCRKLFNRIEEVLGDRLLVGRSRRAGYGGNALIQWGQIDYREWSGKSILGNENEIAPEQIFRVLLTSPYIGRHRITGQLDPSWLQNELREKLKGKAECIRTHWMFERLGGYNRKWSLETPQTLVVAAGSVLVFKASATVGTDEFLEIEHEGIGEQRIEGFGRLLFLSEPQMRLTLNRQKNQPFYAYPEDSASPLVHDIEKRLLEQIITLRIEETASSLAKRTSPIPSNSLLGRLRNPLRGDADKGIVMLREWLGDEQNPGSLRRPAMEKLEQSQIRIDRRRVTLSNWLRELINGEKIATELRLSLIAQRHYLISETSALEALTSQRTELCARLIDALLAALALRNRREGERND